MFCFKSTFLSCIAWPLWGPAVCDKFLVMMTLHCPDRKCLYGMTVLKVLSCILEITHWKPYLGTSCSENWEEKDGIEWRVGGRARVSMDVLRQCILQELFKNP